MQKISSRKNAILKNFLRHADQYFPTYSNIFKTTWRKPGEDKILGLGCITESVPRSKLRGDAPSSYQVYDVNTIARGTVHINLSVSSSPNSFPHPLTTYVTRLARVSSSDVHQDLRTPRGGPQTVPGSWWPPLARGVRPSHPVHRQTASYSQGSFTRATSILPGLPPSYILHLTSHSPIGLSRWKGL